MDAQLLPNDRVDSDPHIPDMFSDIYPSHFTDYVVFFFSYVIVDYVFMSPVTDYVGLFSHFMSITDHVVVYLCFRV